MVHMFWRAVPATGSAIEAILDREAYTLADLLDEEDLVQEARALNGRLVDFLRGPDVVRQLLEYAVGPPSERERGCGSGGARTGAAKRERERRRRRWGQHTARERGAVAFRSVAFAVGRPGVPGD